jgi:hypothetical protein
MFSGKMKFDNPITGASVTGLHLPEKHLTGRLCGMAKQMEQESKHGTYHRCRQVV